MYNGVTKMPQVLNVMSVYSIPRYNIIIIIIIMNLYSARSISHNAHRHCNALRYLGPIPLYAFQARTSILKSILALIGSQRRFVLIAVILILSYFFACINTLADAFSTICNFLSFVYGKPYNRVAIIQS